MSDRRRSHRKATPNGGAPSAVPPVLVAGGAGASLWAASVAAELPAGGAGAVGALGLAGAVWWARRRDRAAVRIRAAEREDMAWAAREAQETWAKETARQSRQLLDVIVAGQSELEWLVGQAERGEPIVPPAKRAAPEAMEGPFGPVEDSLLLAQGAAVQSVYRAVEAQQAKKDKSAELLVSVARRLHALVSRTLKAVSDAQLQIEDAVLLDALFRLDSLTTRTRRMAESIAVLGGHTPRQVASPMGVGRILQQAIAEIEQYPRARWFVTEQVAYLDVPGYAAAAVTHLLAELIENATKFSPPKTQVMVKASTIPAGVVIEIDDRGLTMPPEQLAEMNQLLLNPEEADRGALLERGTIGLLVAALIANRHRISVDLRSNLLGGTQALVVLPKHLLVPAAPVELPSAVRSAPPGDRHQTVLAPGGPAPGHREAGQIPAAPHAPGSPQPDLPRRTSAVGQTTESTTQRPALPRRTTPGDSPPVPAPPAPGLDPTGPVEPTPPNPNFVGVWRAREAEGRQSATSPHTN
ncbi:ATP-binding protein [Streptomyces sp. NPDC002215]|uniref:sensor histidine kinase n=1 Tax=Streptomyces sp. NPDC002215 TaxID=3154412 RepID=UPI003330FE3A